MENITLLDQHGLEITPSKGSHSFTMSATGIATWYEPQSCSRCGGSGIWRGGFTSGTCYGCGGNGAGSDYKVKARTEEAHARFEKRQAVAAKRKADKYQRETEELLKSFSAQLDELEQIREDLRSELTKGFEGRASEFINKVGQTLLACDHDGIFDESRENIARSWIVKSDKTIAALKKTAEKRKADKAARADAPDWQEGRFGISGMVVTTKWVEGGFGASLKMLIALDDGRTCWGSVPSKMDDVDKGSLVSIKATFKTSPEDPKFAFFSRPVVWSQE